MAITQRVALINEQTIKSTSYVQLNVDGKMLSNAVIDTQFINLRPILGDALYQTLLTAVINQNATPPVAMPANLYTLLVDYIHPFLTHTVLEELLVAMSYRLSNKGPLKYNDVQAGNLSSDELRDAKQWHANKAVSYKQVLIRYLTQEKLIENIQTDRDTTSEGTGWFISEDNSCGNGAGFEPIPPPQPPVPDLSGGSGIHIDEAKKINAGKSDDGLSGTLTKPLNFERTTSNDVTSYVQDKDIIISNTAADGVEKSTITVNKNNLILNSAGAMYNTVTTSKPTGEYTVEIIDPTVPSGAVIPRLKLEPGKARLEVSNTPVLIGAYVNIEDETKIEIGLAENEINKKTIRITDNAGMLVTDVMDNEGLQYAADYSAGASDRWLTDKEYVDTTANDASNTAANIAEAAANVHSDANDILTLNAANTYTDTQTISALAVANAYSDTQDAVTLAAANAYSDTGDANTLIAADANALGLVSSVSSGTGNADLTTDPALYSFNTYNLVGGAGTYTNFLSAPATPIVLTSAQVPPTALKSWEVYRTTPTGFWTLREKTFDLSGFVTDAKQDKHDPLINEVRYEHPRGATEQTGNGTFNSPSFGGWGISAVMTASGVVNKIEIPFFGVANTEVEIRVYKQTSVTVLGTQLYAKVYGPGELNQNTAVRTTLSLDIEVSAGDLIGVVMGWKAGTQPIFRYWNVDSGVAPLRTKMIQASTLVYPNMFTNSWSLSSGSVYQAAMKVYFIPPAISTYNTILAGTGLTELIDMQLEKIASDNFTTVGGFSSNPSFPMTPTFIGGAMQLPFTAGTNQSVIFNGVTLVIGTKIEVSIDVRRTAGSGGALDIGNFGSATNTTEAQPYRTLSATEITSTFKTFKFKITPVNAAFVIGLNTTKNVGSTFEIDNIVITKASYKTQAGTDIAALKTASGVIASTVTTGELQAFINANRYVKLGMGTFTITAPLSIPADTIIEGYGAATVLKLPAGATWNIMELTAASSNVTIRNITFQGLAPVVPGTVTRADILAPPSSGNSGIFQVGLGVNVRIENCNFYDFSWAGLHVYNTHTASNYARHLYVSGCFAERCYYGFLFRTRAEYVSFVGNSSCNNKYGIYVAAGNFFAANNQFNANAVGIVYSGTAGQNDSHGSIAGGSANHNFSYAIYVIDISASVILSGLNVFVAGIVLDNAKGAIVESCILGSSDITILNANTSYNLIRNNVFNTANVITGDTTKVSMSGNRYLDGSDSTTLNNLV
jgi:hypothetical protein